LCNADVGYYTNTVCELLAAIDIPTDTLLCRADCAVDHAARLEKYYSDIKCCLLTAASRCIPTVKLVFKNIGKASGDLAVAISMQIEFDVN